LLLRVLFDDESGDVVGDVVGECRYERRGARSPYCRPDGRVGERVLDALDDSK
jgi:hypothetical protein